MPLSSDHEIANLLADTHTIAVIGVPDRPGTAPYEVASYQQSQGYRLFPINDQEKTVLGFQAKASLSDIREPIDVVDVFASPEDVPAIADAAIQARAKALWLQPGAHHPEAVRKAEAAGLTVVTDKCFMKEHRRLLSDLPM
ncbi:CoA-binding protein [Alicyclobacillus cycloheptanicus]|uniref:CoA-binding protein n=1 Tax=Alicyclobacillus cycloheptanicus TaxID=1457 RepID=A0ABT9XH28_9BACL|nr:CoA-binding protein [Alicyclobacillus cycloheptanicus]MDQ0189610.1 putative CoA-binding protein [Alicyclobacillus cycloheptanicus]WDL99919.1 CoA-binding protein [Alicyclobacillus cycloheptanicus]